MTRVIPEAAIQDIGKLLTEAKENKEVRNLVIKQYMPFVIRSVSDLICRYVVVGDSDELSIGLMAFNEAIDRYEVQKGPFLPYARIVISSRLTNYLNQANNKICTVPLEWAEEVAAESSEYSTTVLAEQITIWKNELSRFNITFQKLVIEKPKHKDTRERACEIAESASYNALIVNQMYAKLRLPIQLIHRHLNISVKIIERSRVFIISVVVIFVKELGELKRWIRTE